MESRTNYAILALMLFCMCKIEAQTVTDIDGNTYNTVKIDTFEWMAEDLRTTKCNDGSPILKANIGNDWFNAGMNSTPAYSWYNMDSVMQVTNGYGALYNWHAITSCNICPDGWRVATDSDWTVLIDFLDPGTVIPNVQGLQSSVAGGKMKEVGSSHWISPNGGATNSSGFTGLPGGFRRMDQNQAFDRLGYDAYWWSTTESSLMNLMNYAWNRSLPFSSGVVSRTLSIKGDGLAVRCLRVLEPEQIPTLSEWGLMICGLLLLILGVLGVRSRYRNQEARI